MSLTELESQQLAQLMGKIEWPVALPVFEAWCNNFITNPIELGVLKDDGILMLYRKDRFFDGWHIPGSVLIPGSRVSQVLDRLVRNEVGAKVSEPEFVSWIEIPKEINPRGQELSLLFTCFILEDYFKEGQFFPLSSPPKNILPHHLILVKTIKDWYDTRPINPYDAYI